jgi:hypothetical protein
MRKLFSLFILATLLLAIGFASAVVPHLGNLIGGTIYNDLDSNGNYYQGVDTTVDGALVTVLCNGNTATTLSHDGGIYDVSFSASQCTLGDLLSVSASKGSLSGSKLGQVTNHALDWDVGIVDVPMVPEFGAIVGVLTVLGALGVFFVVRKN